MSEKRSCRTRDARKRRLPSVGLGVTSLLWCQLDPPVLLKVPRGIQHAARLWPNAAS